MNPDLGIKISKRNFTGDEWLVFSVCKNKIDAEQLKDKINNALEFYDEYHSTTMITLQELQQAAQKLQKIEKSIDDFNIMEHTQRELAEEIQSILTEGKN